MELNKFNQSTKYFTRSESGPTYNNSVAGTIEDEPEEVGEVRAGLKRPPVFETDEPKEAVKEVIRRSRFGRIREPIPIMTSEKADVSLDLFGNPATDKTFDPLIQGQVDVGGGKLGFGVGEGKGSITFRKQFDEGGVEREGFKKGGVEGVDFSRTQTKKFKFPFTSGAGTIYYPKPIERKAQQTPQVIKKYKAIKNAFDKAIKTENYNYLVSSIRGKGKLPNQYATEINKLKFGTDEFNKFAERVGLDKNALKDVLNERQNFIAGKKTESTRRGILGKVKNQKIIMETLQKNPSDLKTLAKKTGLTQIQTKEELRKLLQNIYAQRVQIGKGKYAIKGNWSIFLPTDETKLDELQKNFWNTKGIPQIKKDTIGDLFYRAYGKDTLADNVTPNPTRNPARYKKVLQKLREYGNIKDAIEKNTDIKLDLDHPLDRTALNSINATADQMVRVTPVSRSINRGLKEKLQQKINQVNKDIKTAKGAKIFELNNQKKSLNNLVDYLELEFGKISPSGKIKRFGVEPFEKLNLKKEIIDNLSFQNVLADRVKQPEFKELVKKAGLKGFRFNVEKIDIDKLEKAIETHAKKLDQQGLGSRICGRSTGGTGGNDCVNLVKRNPAKFALRALAVGTGAELAAEIAFLLPGFAEGKPYSVLLNESIVGLTGLGTSEEEFIAKLGGPKSIEAFQFKKLKEEQEKDKQTYFALQAGLEGEDEAQVQAAINFFKKQNILKKQREKLMEDAELVAEQQKKGKLAYQDILQKTKEEPSRKFARQALDIITDPFRRELDLPVIGPEGPIGTDLSLEKNTTQDLKTGLRNLPSDIEQDVSEMGIMGEASFALGGRVDFKDGGMDRRSFLKLVGGLASLPVLGKFFKFVKPATKKVLENAPTGTPDWFAPLVEKIAKEGIDISNKAAMIERQTVKELKTPDGTYTLTQTPDTGEITVSVDTLAGVNDAPVDFVMIPNRVTDITKDGKPIVDRGEFNIIEMRATGKMVGPEDYDIDLDEFVTNNLDDVASDWHAVEEFATGKTSKPAQASRRQFKQSVEEDPLEDVLNRQGDYDLSEPELDYD
jgi:hypothetical protein